MRRKVPSARPRMRLWSWFKPKYDLWPKSSQQNADEDVRFTNLHKVADVFTIRQDLGEVLCAEHVAQRRLSQKSSGAVSVFDVRDGDGGVRHSIVDYGVDTDRHRVFRQYLLQSTRCATNSLYT